ncbi:MAG: carbamoyl-phosphate synthase large subunit [Thermoleophilia bacterium]|nr:carbamoyl-phosphate synthase large subunit [Thermoleophilia bacterium]
MPRRDDIRKILVIGSGPIVIGQACEFDYSGTQACQVLMEEGYEVVLVNSNPATIMTDPDFAHKTYIEPLDVPTLAAVIERERPDALLPTLGGQTALNLASRLAESGVLDHHGVTLIGADYDAIHRAEERELFRDAMERIGLRVPRSDLAVSVKEACQKLERLTLPIIVRPSFTLGGHGGGVAYDLDSFCRVVEDGVTASPIGQVLLEESVLGWQEFELEVMRDRADNVVIVCSIENIDPMGVHTGDSITVAPVQTLTDAQYQRLRDASLDIIREIGVETGGSNIQFAVNPETEEIVVIEMNPRVSRSSALASKATGFPIAKIAARLAVGYTLDEIPNDITRKTPACFEPTIDYVVVKTPRWAFEKFPNVDATLTTHMKSVGENMAIGRTFREAFMKSMRSRELDVQVDLAAATEDMLDAVATPTAERYDQILELLRRGVSTDELERATRINPWFLKEFEAIIEQELKLRNHPAAGGGPALTAAELRDAKQTGFSDAQIGEFTGVSEEEVRAARKAAGVIPVYKSVDTCAAEFEAETPYFYSCYDQENEALDSGREKVIILGSGPNRIGQGIEFDYCCVHAVMTARDSGYEAIMVNCNPETVSTDYNMSDRLYFEPLTLEDVLSIVDNERPKGVIVQFGGQTPLKIAHGLAGAGVPILGTPQEAIDLAEDRGRFGAVLRELGIAHPPYGTAMSRDEAVDIAAEIGYPLLVRPSYVLGGRAMEIVYHRNDLERYIHTAVKASPKHPILLDKFLEDATEIDVDAVCDGEDVYIGSVMQHIEEAGVHSGDSACVIPAFTLETKLLKKVKRHTEALALRLGVLGLVNIQYAVKGGEVYVLEANPRGSRTVPYVSKSTGVPLAKVATRVILGEKLKDMDLPAGPAHPRFTVKEAVLPFSRLPGADTTLGPEMKSTGEVMGVASTFPVAFAKAQAAAGQTLPLKGTFFISINDADKPEGVPVGKRLHDLGFKLVATAGTAEALRSAGVPAESVKKFTEGKPNVVDMILTGKIDGVINTPRGRGARVDGYEIRRATLRTGIPCITTMAGAQVAVAAIEAGREPEIQLHNLQELHGGKARST